jgi:HemY protein
MNLRPGDSALDRLHRAETLAKLSSWDREARLALARAALEAREFGRAREVLRPLLEDGPTVRACILMADIEQAEHGTTGRVREWLARAARSPRDPVWIADGVVSDRWAPVSPVTGRLDAFVWQAPPDVLTGPGSTIDDVVADLDDKPRPAIPPPASARDETDAASVSNSRAPVGTPAPERKREGNGVGTELSAERPSAREDDEEHPAPVVFAATHPPDDPGMESETGRPGRRRLFG